LLVESIQVLVLRPYPIKYLYDSSGLSHSSKACTAGNQLAHTQVLLFYHSRPPSAPVQAR
jgi:hypothetical protein